MITIEIKKSNKCNSDYSLYVSFPYEQRIVDIMRSQPIRYWHIDVKQWELPLKSLGNLQQQLQDYKLNIVDSQNLLSNFNFNRLNR